MFSFTKKVDNELGLIVDISNGSVALAIASFSSVSKPNILANRREYFLPSEKPTADFLTNTILNILEKNLADLLNEKNKKSRDYSFTDKQIKHVLVSFSSPWNISMVKNIHLSKETEFVFSKNLINSILKDEKIKLEKLSKEEDFKYKNQKISVVEHFAIQTKLNGYEVLDPFYKKTKNAEISLFMTIAPTFFIEKIENIIKKHLSPSHSVLFHSFPFIIYRTISNIFHNQNNFVIVDIRGEITDISLVLENSIIQNLSFPYGRNSIIRNIAKKFNVPTDVAISMLSSYNKKMLDESAVLLMDEVLEKIELEWMGYFLTAKAELEKTNSLPQKMFLTSANDIGDIIGLFIKGGNDNNFVTKYKTFDIQLVSSELLSDFVTFENKTIQDLFLSIATLFYKSIFI